MTPGFRLAVPNKGRLKEPSTSLLRQAGLVFEQHERALSVPVRNVDLELLFVRTEDVPELVVDGVAELGITGLDLLAETGADVDVVAELGYGRCRLTAAVPNASPVQSLEELAGSRIATAHPRITASFFEAEALDITTIPLRGSVEVAPRLDIADAIVDLVSSGSTMKVNGLRPVATLLDSQAVLVAARPVADSHRSQVDQVATMLRAVVAARRKRYVLMNAPKRALDIIEQLIPGFDAPSIVPIAHDDELVAIHSVVDADDVWRVLPQLKAAGASGILVLPIEQLLA
jgi:ATP phosphoribosyltransferase